MNVEIVDMPPAACERVAFELLQRFAPEHLVEPGALDLVDLLENRLYPLGVDLVPVDPEFETERGKPMADDDLADCVLELGRISIRARAPIAKALVRWRTSNERRGARCVIGHELGHLYHLGFDGGLARYGSEPTPQTWSRDSCNPEVQADIIGCSVLVPRHTLLMLPAGTPLEAVADIYDVGTQWLGEHLYRLALHHRHPYRKMLRGERRSMKWLPNAEFIERARMEPRDRPVAAVREVIAIGTGEPADG